MRWMSNLSIARPVTTWMIVASMVILGLVSILGLPVELMPDFKFPVATISVVYPGVSPEDMEELVAEPIESSIEGIEGIKKLESYSNESATFIVVWFDWGTDLDKKVIDLRDKVSKIRRKLPEGIEEPLVSKIDIMGKDIVMRLTLSGDDLMEVRRFADKTLKPKLERIPGVASIDIFGGFEKEIMVSIDPHKLEAFNLNVNSIIDILRISNINMPAGKIKEGDKEFLIRSMGKLENLDDIKNIVLYNKDGKILYLKDVVNIYLENSEVESYSRMNGNNAVSLEIAKEAEGNSVQISDYVLENIEEFRDIIPNSMTLEIGEDLAEYVRDSMNMVTSNALLGLLLSTIILMLFLKNIRATLIIAVAIPTSIVFTFVLIKYKGISMNLMSLGGLALGVGMLVDNSVIVLENIFRHLTELKKPLLEAARDGAAEMGLPIVASTATTVAVFLPIGMTQGIAGEIFRDFSYTVAFSLAASMLIALSFVPMVSSKFMKEGKSITNEGKVMKSIKDFYKKALNFSLKFRWLVVLLTTIVFFTTVITGVIKGGMAFFPKTDRGTYSVTATLPKGLDIEKSNRLSYKVEKIVAEQNLTKKYITNVTKNSINISVDIGPKEKRKVSVFDVIDEVRKDLKKVPDATIVVKEQGMGPGGGGGSEINILLLGEEDNVLIDLSEKVKKLLASIDNVVEIKSSYEGGNPEVKIKLNREKAEYYGLNIAYVSSVIASKLSGIVPVKLQVSGEEIDVKVQLADEFRNSTSKLEGIIIKSPYGTSVKLSDIAKIERGEGASQVVRQDKLKRVSVGANSSGRDLGSITTDIRKALTELDMPKGYSYKFGGEQEDMMEAMAQLGIAFAVSILLVYMILASQFESFILPFIIMVTVPLALIGVYLGIIITGSSFSIMAMVGIIMLAGIVVNNAIVLIDYINLLVAREVERHEAIHIAGETRLRPILMTTATTVFGMLPLAMGIGAGADMYQPLAMAVIFGLSVSTILTLIVVPVIYSITDDLRMWFSGLFKKKENQEKLDEIATMDYSE